MDEQEFQDWEQRIAERARRLWQDAGRPEGGPEAYADEARERVALEENPRAATRAPDEPDPDGEPLEAVENQGEFPTLTDQGDEQGAPTRVDGPDWSR